MESEMKKMTDVDEKTLTLLPTGCWFDIDMVPYRVRCPRFRLDRLTELGLLESKVEGELSELKMMWKKLE